MSLEIPPRGSLGPCGCCGQTELRIKLWATSLSIAKTASRFSVKALFALDQAAR